MNDNGKYMVNSERYSPHNKQKQLAKVFVILSVLFGLMIILLEPPFSTSDEHSHYTNICRISHINLFADCLNGKVGSYITSEELNYLAHNCDIPNMHANYSVVKELTRRDASTDLVFYENLAATLSPIPYLLPAIVLFLIRSLGIMVNGYNGYLIAKMVNLAFYILVTRQAILKTKLFPKTMFFIALLPMSIFQAASTSYDAYLIPCSFLFFAYVTKLLFADKAYKVSLEDILAICLASIFVVCCKIAYAPMLLMLLTIPVKRFKSYKQYFGCIAAVVAVLVVTFVIPQIITAGIKAGAAVVALAPEQVAQKEFLLSNLGVFPGIILNSIKENGRIYIESFIGTLGWMDTPFPMPFLLLFYMMLFFVAGSESGAVKGVGVWPRAAAFISFMVFFLGSLYTMYVEWTPSHYGVVGGDLIYGFQGRYLIPFALLMLVPCCSSVWCKLKVADKWNALCDEILPYISFVGLCLLWTLMMMKYVA